MKPLRTELDHLRYPIGRFIFKETISDVETEEHISTLKKMPLILYRMVKDWPDEALDTRYRPGGWSVRQLLNHIADSHSIAFIRFKYALTSEEPIMVSYNQDLFADMPDSMMMSITPSLRMISGVHARWTKLLNGLTNKMMEKTYINPENGDEETLRQYIMYYAWHFRHHLAHIELVKHQKGL